MPGEKDYSEKTAEAIDMEVKKIMTIAYEKAKELIQANKQKLERTAQALLKYETLDADDVELILQGKELSKPTVSDLLAAEKAKDNSPDNPESETETKQDSTGN
jgi:cell division protease FtsH